MQRILLIACLWLIGLFGWAQTDTLLTVKGRVIDNDTRRAMGYVSVTNGQVSSVTNQDGEFALKIKRGSEQLRFSYMGYKTQSITLAAIDISKPIQVKMRPVSLMLSDIVVEGGDWKELVGQAIDRIGQNYPNNPNLLKGFYRETVRKRNRFICIAEAVLDIYKNSYSKTDYHDRVAISRGRRLLSMKASDTLAVKLEGGPMIPVLMDVVKNKEMLLTRNELEHYHFRAGVPEKVGQRMLYTIHISPAYILDYPLFNGTIYLDQQTLAFVRIELSLDMTDKAKATHLMLRRKPLGLRFTPHELTIRADYEVDSTGISRLHYVSNTMRFRCDWKRRVFKSNFTVESEMVVTHWNDGPDVKPIRGRDTFNSRDRFYDKVELFDDPDFWGPANIIEPTESLEKAVGKLRKLFH